MSSGVGLVAYLNMDKLCDGFKVRFLVVFLLAKAFYRLKDGVLPLSSVRKYFLGNIYVIFDRHFLFLFFVITF